MQDKEKVLLPLAPLVDMSWGRVLRDAQEAKIISDLALAHANLNLTVKERQRLCKLARRELGKENVDEGKPLFVAIENITIDTRRAARLADLALSPQLAARGELAMEWAWLSRRAKHDPLKAAVHNRIREKTEERVEAERAERMAEREAADAAERKAEEERAARVAEARARPW